jgi:hypothetical protein
MELVASDSYENIFVFSIYWKSDDTGGAADSALVSARIASDSTSHYGETSIENRFEVVQEQLSTQTIVNQPFCNLNTSLNQCNL